MGPGTSNQLRKHGYVAEIPDTEYSSEGVINLINKSEVTGKTLVIKGEGGLSMILWTLIFSVLYSGAQSYFDELI